MQTKICSNCGIEKILSEFSKDKTHDDGLCSVCKRCRKKYSKEYCKINKEKIFLRNKKYRESHREYYQDFHKKYREANKDKITYYLKNYFQKNKDKINRYKKIQRDNNINLKLRSSLSARLYDALKYNRKSKHTIELLGCSIEFLKSHLEKQFQPGMNWKNHSINGWHIDHIKPCASFDLSKLEEQKKCFHYSNLQPLWAKDNRKKSANYNREILKENYE